MNLDAEVCSLVVACVEWVLAVAVVVEKGEEVVPVPEVAPNLEAASVSVTPVDFAYSPAR